MSKSVQQPDLDLTAFLDHSNTGLAIATWDFESPQDSRWVYVNNKRCSMCGFTFEEVMNKSPLEGAARETEPHINVLISELKRCGEYKFDSVLLCKNKSVIPVELHIALVNVHGTDYVMIEYYDLTNERQTQAHLQRMEENSREMLTLLEKEKNQIRNTMEENIAQVVLPLLDQLSAASQNNQEDIISLLKDRISHISQEAGIKNSIRSVASLLTRKQRLICEMIQNGMSTKAIARTQGCSPRTIDNHRNAIRKKLNLSGKNVSLDTFLSTS